jgi:hypothetical protein
VSDDRLGRVPSTVTKPWSEIDADEGLALALSGRHR